LATESNAQPKPQAILKQPAAFIEEAPDKSLAPVIVTKLSSLLNQFKALKQEVLELQSIICKRLNAIEKNVIATQRYINNLVP